MAPAPRQPSSEPWVSGLAIVIRDACPFAVDRAHKFRAEHPAPRAKLARRVQFTRDPGELETRPVPQPQDQLRQRPAPVSVARLPRLKGCHDDGAVIPFN